ncbi:hypothetical protein C8J56DRAFT_475688 [Mycena floridula]|nr:hypothetical protein C8J56DRAFT_475688 [Mycena floridula]
MDTSTRSFPKLPLELTFLIMEKLFEIAPKRCIDLITLSREIYLIAKKALYRSVVLDDFDTARLFIRMIESGYRSPAFYQQNVHTLCISPQVELSEIRAVLSVCSNVQKLAVFDWYNVDKTSFEALGSSGPSPSMLSCDAAWAFHTQGSALAHRFALPLFQNVTHLELCGYHFDSFEAEQLHSLPRLTHMLLCMISATAPQIVHLLQQLLSLIDSVVVCIVYIASDDNGLGSPFEAILVSKDFRVVVALDPRANHRPSRYEDILGRDLLDTSHFIRQWGTPLPEAEMDMWDQAEAIVKIQRLKADIDSNRWRIRRWKLSDSLRRCGGMDGKKRKERKRQVGRLFCGE